MMKYLLPFLFCFSTLAQYSATSTQFCSLPLAGEASLRIASGVALDAQRSQELQGSLVYQIPFGMQVGLGVHAGITRAPSYLEAGADIMLGYFYNFTNDFFAGAQSQLGLTYTGINNVTVTSEHAAALPLKFSVTVGGRVNSQSLLYVSPSIELGHTMRGGDTVWKSGVGLQLGFGAGIPLSKNLVLALNISPTFAEGDFMLKSNADLLFQF